AGQTRGYELRLIRPNGMYGSAAFTVRGLPEFTVPNGTTNTLINPPPAQYSEITINGALNIFSGYWNVECAGDVTINGRIDGKGADGANANGQFGGAAGRHGGAGGRGRNDGTFADLPGPNSPEDENYGANGNDCIGISADNDVQRPCRPFVTVGKTIPG